MSTVQWNRQDCYVYDWNDDQIKYREVKWQWVERKKDADYALSDYHKNTYVTYNTDGLYAVANWEDGGKYLTPPQESLDAARVAYLMIVK
jgi:hypothetical protein